MGARVPAPECPTSAPRPSYAMRDTNSLSTNNFSHAWILRYEMFTDVATHL